MKAGLIGTGRLGSALGRRLMEQRVRLTAWDRTPAQAEALGATKAASPAAVAGAVDVVFLCVSGSDAVRDVLEGPGGVLEADVEGKLVVDATTNRFDRVERFHAHVAAAGGQYVEAPVSGDVPAALRGALTIYASGTEEAVRRALPYLDLLARKVLYLGGPGRAARMKAIDNLVLASLLAALSEAVVLGEAAGFRRDEVLDALSSGAGRSALLDAERDRLEQGDFEPGFAAALLLRDLRDARDLAASLGRHALSGRFAEELCERLVEEGRGDRDGAAMVEILK